MASTVTAPARPELACAPGLELSTESISSGRVNDAYRKWLPGAPLGSTAPVGNFGTGRTGFASEMLDARSSWDRMFTIWAVGFPVASSLRMVCGTSCPKPLLASSRLIRFVGPSGADSGPHAVKPRARTATPVIRRVFAVMGRRACWGGEEAPSGRTG